MEKVFMSEQPQRTLDYFFGALDAPLMAAHWHHDTDAYFPPHGHAFIEIVVIASGSVRQRSPQGWSDLRAGNVVVLRPGCWHEYGRARRVSAFNLCFTEELLWAEFPALLKEPAIGHLLWRLPSSGPTPGIARLSLPDPTMRQAIKHLRELSRLCGRDEPLARVRRLGQLANCLSIIATEASKLAPRQVCNAPAYHPAVFTVVKLLADDLSQPWSLEELATRVKLNKSYLARRFRAAMGCTIGEYIARRRAESAGALLVSTDKPIAEIARAVGWDDPNYFARQFREHFGLCARAYRSAQRNEPDHLTTTTQR